jgi:hypothetical protein
VEHAYSGSPVNWKVYYYFLQIAFIITQLVERGSLLRQLAAEVLKQHGYCTIEAASGSEAVLLLHRPLL